MKKLAQQLINLDRTLTAKKEIIFTEKNIEANRFVVSTPLAFVLGVLFDERRTAEDVWEAPFKLYKYLGHLSPQKIAKLSHHEIVKIFENAGLQFLSRYRSIAKWVLDACKKVCDEYDAKAENIWNDKPRSSDLYRRFLGFNGIGQKKASMAVNILVRDFGIEINGSKQLIDVSYDRHVRRVFLRTGLVNEDNEVTIVQAARKLNREYPGALDLPMWEIGRTWCRPTNPDCNGCILSTLCPRYVHLGE